VVEIIKGNVFNNKNPILVGMKVKHGVMRVGTPLCVPDKAFIKIGKVASIQFNGKNLTEAKPDTGDVSVKIEGEPTVQVGRSFEENNSICSVITKQSI
jgi:translation initiation factor 5B